jgi:hypothetical protein
MQRVCFPLLLTACWAMGLVGCGQDSGPALGKVTGTVTLDGKPLPGASVTFYPANEGRPSQGTTDESGKYTLRFTGSKEGAMLGQHTVQVEVGVPVGEGETQPASNLPQLPAKYNKNTELTAEVKRGSNTIDFNLTSN